MRLRPQHDFRRGDRAGVEIAEGLRPFGQGTLLPISLYVAHYNLCCVHESLRSTPAMALGIPSRAWTIDNLLDAALATEPAAPENAPNQRRFRVIEDGKK